MPSLKSVRSFDGPSLSHMRPRNIGLHLGRCAGDGLEKYRLYLFLFPKLMVTDHHRCECRLGNRTRRTCSHVERQKLALYRRVQNMEGVWPRWPESNTAETLLCFFRSYALSWLHAMLCMCAHRQGLGQVWGLCHTLLHMKTTALDASSLNWLNFREKFAPLIKTCFTEHRVWP